MPRFVSRPLVVEAFPYDGHLHLWPEDFRAAVRRRLHGGEAEIMCGHELRRCAHGDWIVRGPDGVFAVYRAATFEMWFAEQPVALVAAAAEMPPDPIARKPVTRKEQACAHKP